MSATFTDRPAFPVTAGHEVYSIGMTLRDWFAGTASDMDVNHYQNWNAPDHWPEFTRAEARYRYADAMIAESQKQEPHDA